MTISHLVNAVFTAFKRVQNQLWLLKRKSPIKIWFLVPCYHTNMVPMVQAFLEAGDSVKVIVSKIESTENHHDLSPILISEFIYKIDDYLKHQSPDIVIFRDQSPDMLNAVHSCAKKGARIIHYTQKPSRRPAGHKELRRDISRVRAKQLKKLPLSTITPLLANPKNPPRLLHQTFYFPVNPNKSPRNKDQTPLRVLQVGKLAQPRKRHNWTIRALTEINLPVHLVICGADLDLENDDGTRSEEYYHQLLAAATENCAARPLKITIRKNLAQDELWKEYATADIFTLPSLNEEFGISVIEAMAAECAVVVSDSTGSSRHIKSWYNGVVFPENEFPCYRDSLQLLMENGAKRKEIQRNAKKAINTVHKKENFRRFILHYG